ncbi:MAG: hypothetical protein WBQ46_16825 [Terriglobales bacterium]
MGRTAGSTPELHTITLSETRKLILETSKRFKSLDFGPHPLSPETICIGYLSRRDGVAVTTKVNRQLYRAATNNGSMVVPLFFPPGRQAGLDYNDLFRVTIVSYLDRFTFTDEAARYSAIAFATDDNRLIPLDTYYLFYQGGKQQALITITAQ